MKVRIATALCVGALITGCADHSPAAGPAAAASAPAAATSREVAIYAAVIRKLVLGANGTAPDATPYKRVWVLDHRVRNAAEPAGDDQLGSPLGEELETALRQALAGLPPLEFIPDPATAIVRDNSPVLPLRDHIRGHGTIIVLGPIEAHGNAVHVGHEQWCAAHCAEWFTSVLHESDGRWVVTGEAGGHAIT